MKTHGAAVDGRRTPEYNAWLAMKYRCQNPGDQKYKDYGGRGIAVCERWLDFAAFLADMGPRPSPVHSIDRTDNDLGYSPGNCRWATAGEQARNTSRNRILTHAGRTMCVADWAAEYGLNENTLYGRLHRGLTLAEALSR